MKKIITIGGSTSQKSINKQLAEHVGGLVEGVEVLKLDLNDYKMPIFSIDIENEQGFSKGINDLNDLVDTADGFVISLAEHNGAYSAAFKNAFDWLSRINGKVWREKPVLLLSTSPGARGGQSALEIAEKRFPYNGAKIVGSMAFPSFFDNFRDDRIVNTELKEQVLGMVDRFKKEL